MLRIPHKLKPRNMPKASGRHPDGHGKGPQGRIDRLRQLVTALIRHERIEGCRAYLDEARGYAERLIQVAAKHGDKHKPTMEVCDYWLLEKDLIHKLHKVIVPRFTESSTAATNLFTLPTQYPGKGMELGVLELKGNPWPPVVPKQNDLRNTLVNVLLDEAKKNYRKEKYQQMVQDIEATSEQMDKLADKTLEDIVETIESSKVDSSSVPKDGTPV